MRKVFGRREVLTAASFWAEPGKITTLMGRNGSGKTTLLRVAAGVLRSEQGVVALDGTVILRPTLAALARRGLMYVPQARLLARGYTVEGHLRAVANTFAGPPPEEVAAVTDLEDLMTARVDALSGGERARVSVALAIARAPRALLIDEPLAGLSPLHQEGLGSLLREAAARGAAIVTTGHDTNPLLEISDVIIWSVAGTTHHLGTPQEAVAHDRFRREYLGPRFGG